MQYLDLPVFSQTLVFLIYSIQSSYISIWVYSILVFLANNLNRAQNYFLDPSGYYMCTTTQVGNVVNYDHKPGYLSGFVMPDIPSSPYKVLLIKFLEIYQNYSISSYESDYLYYLEWRKHYYR